MSRHAAPLVAGVDGCPAGWVAIVGFTADACWMVVGDGLTELVDRHPRVRCWAIDIPIGLADSEPRGCDAAARRRLGRGRSSSVFPAPPRSVVDSPITEYVEACRLAAAATGKKISKQAWNLVPKIREARSLLRDWPRPHSRVFETHPELAFMRLAGGAALVDGKKTAAGQQRRERLLSKAFGRAAVSRVITQAESTRGVNVDDALDAMACWTAANRIAGGAAESEPSDAEVDATGLPMAILW